MIVGRPALLLTGQDKWDKGFPTPQADVLEVLIAAARRNDVPVIRFERRGGITRVASARRHETGREPVHGEAGSDYVLPIWRHSCFRGTELEILLKGLKAETLIFAGADTDVEIHYGFVDSHQHDYFTRVAEDCVTGSSEAAHDYALGAMEYLQAGARRSAAAFCAAFERGG